MRRGVVPAPALLPEMRVFTRPVIGRSFPARDRGVVRPPGRRSPRGVRPRILSSTPCAGSACRKDIRSPSWFLSGFSPPEANAAPFVSPRASTRSHRASQGEGCPLGHAPVANGLLNRRKERSPLPGPDAMPPRRPTPRHPQVRTSPDLPPSGRSQDKAADEVGDNFPIFEV